LMLSIAALEGGQRRRSVPVFSSMLCEGAS
jgi:hypothetical protein